MRKRIELALNLLVVGFAAFLVIAFVRSGLAPWDRPLIPAVIRAGETLPSIPGLGAEADGDTLVIAVRTGCEYCEASMPFYSKLASLRRTGVLKPALLVVMPDDAAAARAFLVRRGVAAPLDAGVPLSALHVAGTPTLILANAQRKVLHVWVGELTKAGQQRVLERLGAVPAGYRD